MQIYRQEVLKIDPINTKGRRAKEIVVTKIKDIKNAERMTKKHSPQSEAGPSTTTTTTTTKESKSRHVTTEAEKSILNPYFENLNPSSEETEAVLDLLLKISSDYWTKQKIRNAWGYAQRKKKHNHNS